MSLVAVLTPAFNRAYCLDKLYNSLKKQTSKNFKWVIVDDGSTDNTQDLVNNFINEKQIKIEYIKKKNGGKHTALNVGLSHIKEDLTLIVDTDDFLTDDAVSIIENDYAKINNNPIIAGIGYLKLDQNGMVVGKKYTKDGRVDNFVHERINRNTSGDKAEVWKTKILKNFAFPEFEGEKFLSEATVWCKISLEYKMLFINKGIYVCEYLEDGLSHNIQKTLFKNPQGAAECYRIMSGKQTNLKYKFKYTIAFAAYAFAAKIKFKTQFKKVHSKIIYLMTFWVGYLIFLRKRKQMLKEKKVG